ncbi:MAG: DUF4160 domain-containing protein, partial [bacterium]|nr:DUF4160 domain-containing protein [bacterium]
MSPTVFRHGAYRFFFFSREEQRMHVHVMCAEGEAKYWLEPAVELAENHGIALRHMDALARIIEEHRDEIENAWRRHL